MTEDEKKLLDTVLERYAEMSSWELSSLLRAEYSWRRVRKGLKSDENGDVEMELNAMKVDTAREKAYRRRNTL